MPFREIVGHRAVILRISRAVARGTLPPSLLLTGPDGVGKRAVADAIARALNCTAARREADGLALDACGTCAACRRIGRGVHPDVVVLDPDGGESIPIDRVRDALGQTAYRPFEGRCRLVIVDPADRLVPGAQHALLKTLEEPPPHAQFVLVTSRPDLLFDTVRSRCPRLRLGPLDVDDVVGLLTSRHGVDEPAARAAAAVAGGSPGVALQAASGALSTARDAALALLDAVAAARDPTARLGGARAFAGGSGGRRAPAADRGELRARLRMLASVLRDVVAVRAGTDAGLANADQADRLRRLAAAYDARRSVRAFAVVGEALDAVDRNVSPKVVADRVACRL